MKTLDRDDAEEGFEVTPDLERELIAAIEEAERGETIPAAELLERLRQQSTPKPLTKSPSSP